jgi:hypothetical protein
MLRELGSELCVVERQKVWGGKLQNSGPTVGPDGNSKEDVKEAEMQLWGWLGCGFMVLN